MEAIDFLTILGIGIALWQFISPQERKIISLYFSPFEIRFSILLVLFLHFLFAFEWLRINWIDCLNYFVIEKGIPPQTYAYIISLILILYPVLKISYSFFSRSRKDNLINWYKDLLKNGEVNLLVNYIKRYHLKDIKKFLRGYANLPEDDNLLHIDPDEETIRSISYDKLTKSTRLNYAASVYYDIIYNEYFIKKASDNYVEIFTNIIKTAAKFSLEQKDFVQAFLKECFENKHSSFVSELKLISCSNESIKVFSKKFNIPILESLFTSSKYASTNEIWEPIYNLTIRSLNEENHQIQFLRKENDFLIEEKLWNQKVFIAIVYFNYMIRESIYRDGGWHMWLFLYDRINKLLIEEVIEEPDSTKFSFAHKLIEDIINNMLDWIDLARELKVDHRIIDTARCLGRTIVNLSEADEMKISRNFKKNQFIKIFKRWFLLFNYPNNKAAKIAMQWIEFMLVNPINPSNKAKEFPENYLALFKESWNKFDKEPYKNWENNGQIPLFKKRVLETLGIKSIN